MASSKPSVNNAAKAELPVLIIGAGLAGLTVALHMAESQPVILMAKRGLGEAATAWAQGGIVGVVDKEHDSIDSHVADTLDAGAGLVVESTARFIAEESAEAIRWLVEQGVPAEQIDEAKLQSVMYWPELPEPDLIVRTSGEQRLSGFLLWESAYSELYWTNVHWPAFDEGELDKALEEYVNRQRRFGK